MKMPTSGIRIVNETNLHTISPFKGFPDATHPFEDLVRDNSNDGDEAMAVPVTLNNVLVMENIEPSGSHPTLLSATPTGKTFVNLDSKAWQGGFSTIVTPTTVQTAANNMATAANPLMSDTPVFAEIQSNMAMPAVRARSRRGVKLETDSLSPEEEEKLKMRRERNKQAAARCRKRRVDQTDSLQSQVDSWEEKKRLLQAEIHALQTQKEELQFILDAHKSVCNQRQLNNTTTSNLSSLANSVNNNTTTTTSLNNNISTSLNSSSSVVGGVGGAPLRNHVMSTSRSANNAAVLSVPKVVVKCEETSSLVDSLQQQQQPDLHYLVNHLTHEEALNMPVSSPPEPVTAPAPPPLTLPPSMVSRPTTLSLSIKPQNLRSIEGIPIDTPTNVFSSLNFDALMDGRTGLTPTNVLTPVSITMSLQTPVVPKPPSLCSSISNTLTTPTCSTQQRHGNGAGGLSPENSKPKLVSL